MGVGVVANEIGSLTDLTSLALPGNEIGNEGARALASLPELTSLRLYGNHLGKEGGEALLERWSEPPIAEQAHSLDLRENAGTSALLPEEAVETTDAQAILAAYRRFRADRA